MRFILTHRDEGAGAGSVLYVPAGQIVHALEPEDAAYVPDGHTTQVLDAVALTAALKVPAPQAVQSESASCLAASVAASERYFPDGQEVQSAIES